MAFGCDVKKLLVVAALVAAFPAAAMDFNEKYDGNIKVHNTDVSMQTVVEGYKANEMFKESRAILDKQTRSQVENNTKEYNNKIALLDERENKVTEREKKMGDCAQCVKDAKKTTKKWTRGTDIVVGALVLCAYDELLGGQHVKKAALAGYTLAQATWKESKNLYKKMYRTWHVWFPKKPANLAEAQKEDKSQKQQQVDSQSLKPGFGGTDVR